MLAGSMNDASSGLTMLAKGTAASAIFISAA
jgi:hypothetical protein